MQEIAKNSNIFNICWRGVYSKKTDNSKLTLCLPACHTYSSVRAVLPLQRHSTGLSETAGSWGTAGRLWRTVGVGWEEVAPFQHGECGKDCRGSFGCCFTGSHGDTCGHSSVRHLLHGTVLQMHYHHNQFLKY